MNQLRTYLVGAVIAFVLFFAADKVHAGQDVIFLPSFNSSGFFVSTFNANTGATIKDMLVSAIEGGQAGVAVTEGKLFFARRNGVVAVYDATTGALLNSALTNLPDAAAIAASGSHLYIANNVGARGQARISEYTTAGQLVNANLVTGLWGPVGIAVDDAYLYVTDNGTETIGKYPRAGGAGNPALVSNFQNPVGITISDNKIFMTDTGDEMIHVYTTTGQVITSWRIVPEPGMGFPTAIAVLGTHVFVTDEDANKVHEYTTAGDIISLAFISGIQQPSYIALGNIEPPGQITSFSATAPTAPMAPMHFSATAAPGSTLHVEFSFTPDADGTWSPLADGGAMKEDSTKPGFYSLTTSFYPGGNKISFRAVSTPDGFPPNASAPIGTYDLHPPTGPAAMTHFTVNGSGAPTTNVADSVLSFAVDQSGTAAGLNVRVQFTTGDPKSLSSTWQELPNGTRGFMLRDLSRGPENYVLNTTNYPLQNGITFRAISSAPGYADTISNFVGSFNLASNTVHLGPTVLYITRNGPVANLRFGVTETTIPSGITVKIQYTLTPGDEESWVDLGIDKLTPDTKSVPPLPHEFYGALDEFVPTVDVYFRAIASATGKVNGLSQPKGPYTFIKDPAPTVDLALGDISPHTGEDFDHPIQAPSTSFKIKVTAQSARAVKHVALQLDGDTLESYETAPAEGHTLDYSAHTPGDHIVEAVATDEVGVVGDAAPVHLRVLPGAPGRVLYNLAAGDWSDPAHWAEADRTAAKTPPGPDDFAVLADIDVNITSDVTVRAVSLNGGTINGPKKLTVTGFCTIGSGRIAADIDVADGATLLFINDSDVEIGSILTNLGRMKIHGNGGITGIPRTGTLLSAEAPGVTSNGFFDGLVAAIRNFGNWIFHRPAGGRPGSGSPTRPHPAPVPELRPILASAVGNAGVVSHDGGTVVSHDGGTVVSHDGGTVVSHDGGTLVSHDGGSLADTVNEVGKGEQASIISKDGAGLIGQDGSGLIGQDGSGLISQDGGGLVATGGGNLVGHAGAAFISSSGTGASASLSQPLTASPAFVTQQGGNLDLNGLAVQGSVNVTGGVLAGSALIKGDLTNNAGYVTPGHSAGLFAVTGNFVQGANGTLVIEDGGYDPSQFDQLQVGGNASLGGKLDVKTINGYTPITSDRFAPLGFHSVSGSFASVSGNAKVTAQATGLVASVDAAKPNPTSGQPLNISTRMEVLNGENVLIAGFIISGPPASRKKVIIRGLGPSLPVGGTLSDPYLELHQPGGSVVTNDNWADAPNKDQIPAGFAPKNVNESALVATLPPGGYTAIVKGAHGETGVGLVEVYDLAAGSAAELANISTRGFVDNGDNVMIAGIIVGGQDAAHPFAGEPATFVLRALGPSLAGVQGALAHTTLELHDQNGASVTNDGWQATQESEIQATGVAPSDPREAAMVATLVPGQYTAVVRGADNTTGVAVVEAYNLH